MNKLLSSLFIALVLFISTCHITCAAQPAGQQMSCCCQSTDDVGGGCGVESPGCCGQPDGQPLLLPALEIPASASYVDIRVPALLKRVAKAHPVIANTRGPERLSTNKRYLLMRSLLI
jgi:hypothetical protein